MGLCSFLQVYRVSTPVISLDSKGMMTDWTVFAFQNLALTFPSGLELTDFNAFLDGIDLSNFFTPLLREIILYLFVKVPSYSVFTFLWVILKFSHF